MDLVERIDIGSVQPDRFSMGLEARLPAAYSVMRRTGEVVGGLKLLAEELPKLLRPTTSWVEGLWALVRMSEKRSGHINIATTSARVTGSFGAPVTSSIDVLCVCVLVVVCNSFCWLIHQWS